MKRILFVLFILIFASIACEYTPIDPTAPPETPNFIPTETVSPTETPEIPTPTPIVGIPPEEPGGIFIVGVTHLFQRVCENGPVANPIAECPYLRHNNGQPNYAPENSIYEVFSVFTTGNIKWGCVNDSCTKVLAMCYGGEAYGEYRVATTVDQYLRNNKGILVECE